MVRICIIFLLVGAAKPKKQRTSWQHRQREREGSYRSQVKGLGTREETEAKFRMQQKPDWPCKEDDGQVSRELCVWRWRRGGEARYRHIWEAELRTWTCIASKESGTKGLSQNTKAQVKKLHRRNNRELKQVVSKMITETACVHEPKTLQKEWSPQQWFIAGQRSLEVGISEKGRW